MAIADMDLFEDLPLPDLSAWAGRRVLVDANLSAETIARISAEKGLEVWVPQRTTAGSRGSSDPRDTWVRRRCGAVG